MAEILATRIIEIQNLMANIMEDLFGLLMVLQIALTLILLSGGSLLFRTIHSLWGVNHGFDPLHIITFQVGLSPSVTNTPLRERIAYQQLMERIRQI
jgi:hypothetical protein